MYWMKTKTTLEEVLHVLDEDEDEPMMAGSDEEFDVLEDIEIHENEDETNYTLMQVIVNETNRYAQQVMDDNSYAKWKRVDLAEMKAYFGFNILMGLVPMPAIDDYWKLDPHFNYGPISSRISRNRFREISRFLHFVDNATLPTRGEEGYDKLGKVRPIIDAVSAAIRVSYAPSKEIAVDEAMIAFQG
eukprot:Em0012g28a